MIVGGAFAEIFSLPCDLAISSHPLVLSLFDATKINDPIRFVREHESVFTCLYDYMDVL